MSGTLGISNFYQESTSNLSITACQRCRDQKLKCSRERPICIRCKRLQADCFYPAPPNRSHSRALRGRIQRKHPNHRAPSLTNSGNSNHGLVSSPSQNITSFGRFLQQVASGQTQTANGSRLQDDPLEEREPGSCLDYSMTNDDISEIMAISSASYSTHVRSLHHPANRIPTRENPNMESSPRLPPRTVGLALLEVYFTRVSTAPLMFFKPYLFQQYIQDELPDYLLRAIFALACLFVKPREDADKSAAHFVSELKGLCFFHSCSFPWAEGAMKEVMGLIVYELSLHMIQTLECLAIYWFWTGYSRNSDLCLAIAHRSCSILGYDKVNNAHLRESSSSLQLELERRCLWACWMSMCVSAQPEHYMKNACSEMAHIPLPGEMSASLSGWNVSLGSQMDADWLLIRHSNDGNNGKGINTSADLIKLMGVWAKIQSFTIEYPKLSAQDILAKSAEISRLLGSYRVQAYDDTHLESHFVIIRLQAFYHMANMSFYTLISPSASSSATVIPLNAESPQSSRMVALHHAHLFAKLLKSYQNKNHDGNYICPLLGYGAFMAGVILLKNEISLPDFQPNPDRHFGVERGAIERTLLDIVDILSVCANYWKILEIPRDRLRDAVSRIGYNTYHCSSAPSSINHSVTAASNVENTYLANLGEDLGSLPSAALPCPPQETILTYPEPQQRAEGNLVSTNETESSGITATETLSQVAMEELLDLSDTSWWNCELTI